MNIMRKHIGWMVLSFCIVWSNAVLPSTLVSKFDSGSEGWTQLEIDQNTWQIINSYPVNWSATGGNPDGHIWANDFGPTGWLFGAPAQYLGDKSGSIGGKIQFDLLTTPTPNAQDQVNHLLLRSPSLLLVYSDPAGGPSTTWTHYDVLLNAGPGWVAAPLDSAGKVSGGFLPATTADYEMALSNLLSIEIRGDFIDGNEISRLDNFSMTVVPIPAAIWLFGSSLAALSVFRKRRTT